jgi:hypothetical protein
MLNPSCSVAAFVENSEPHTGARPSVRVCGGLIKPPRCTSAGLFFSCCGSVAALPALANCNEHVAKTNITRSHPPIPSALCTASKAREVGVVIPLDSPVRDTRARATGISCFPCQTSTRSYLHFSVPTSEPRDVPRCGALSLLQKTPHYRGGPAETAARLNVKLCVLTD